MTEKVINKADALPDLDDLLQCPVCYEIPSGQIFQCNEGHHVCGRCKMRLDVCPVCRAFFFGTRNYAMEELIANVRRLRAFKLGGKVTTGSAPEENIEELRESTSEENESGDNNVEEDEDDASSRTSVQPPKACKGLFRCLCCKNNPERLPSARLLNHLRYFHAPDLIEGRSENGEYLQAWQFSTAPGRLATAVRIADMGIFFLIIEISDETVYAWLSMASSPWVAHEFSYTLTLSGNDREAIFSDCVWSVRSCEGSLKKRGRCLCVRGGDGRALLAPAAMSGKLAVRRTPHELLPATAQPRAVLRVANRSTDAQPQPHPQPIIAQDLEPFLQDLQNDVARLSRAFATLGREANALVRSEAEMRARLENTSTRPTENERSPATARADPDPQPAALPNGQPEPAERPHLSRNARRRMRQRLRDAFRETPASEDGSSVSTQSTRDNDRTDGTAGTNDQGSESVSRITGAPNMSGTRNQNRNIVNRSQNNPVNNSARVTNNTENSSNTARSNANRNTNNVQRNNQSNENVVFIGHAVIHPATPSPPAASPPPVGPSYPNVNGNVSRNKKKRRHRR